MPHTPGPFVIQAAPTSLVHVYDEKNRMVARFGGFHTGIDEDGANANLFAAAPEMLRLLGEAHAALHTDTVEDKQLRDEIETLLRAQRVMG